MNDLRTTLTRALLMSALLWGVPSVASAQEAADTAPEAPEQVADDSGEDERQEAALRALKRAQQAIDEGDDASDSDDAQREETTEALTETGSTPPRQLVENTAESTEGNTPGVTEDDSPADASELDAAEPVTAQADPLDEPEPQDDYGDSAEEDAAIFGAYDEPEESPEADAIVDAEVPADLIEDAILDAELAAQAPADAGALNEELATDAQIEPGVGLDADQTARLRDFFARITDEDETSWPRPAALRSLQAVSSRLLGVGGDYLVLTPYVADPRWPQAMQLLVEDECDDALTLATDILGPPELHADGEPAVRYAFARIQMCADARAQGLATMRQLAELPTAVGELARRALGRSRQQAVEDEAMALSSHIRQAERRANDGEVDQALRDLYELRQELKQSWDQYQVRRAEARILERAERPLEAAQVWLGIYRMTRSWRSSDRIAGDVEDAMRRLDVAIPFGDRIDRMRELIARGRYRHAHQVSRENARLRNVSGSEIRGWTRYREALQNERERKREKALQEFAEAERLVRDPAIRPRLYFGWARALRRMDRDSEAIALYQRLCHEYPTNALCPEALYEAGRLYQFKNKHEEARAHFFDLVGLHPFSSHVPDALWRTALSAYLQEDYDAAIPPLLDLVNHYGHIKDESELTLGLKARYWLGVNHLKAGRTDQARHWLQNTIDSGPLTWYGRLAVARLEQHELPAHVRLPTINLNAEEIANFATLRLPHNPRLEVGAELVRLSLYKDALAEVRRQQAVHPIPEGTVQLRAGLHLAVDEPNWAHWIMKSVIDERGPSLRNIRDWGFAFPVNYMELAHKYGDAYGVSPFLVQAIIRQESGFRPTVKSYAGAMGLMQLMPGTARYTSRTFLEEGSVSSRQILNPDTNVRLGTMYIRIHIAHAHDRPALALAGYNAGPAPLRSWMDRFGDREVDAWVESITYQEARGYVRKVMTSFITYQGLYGDGTLPDIPLEMPEDLRPWGKIPEVEAAASEPVSMLLVF
ncbi:tetratricopeptide repeat protein [Lujinxingia vulgaris]|uniref:Tetratricopeptide repeat protein n=1 Tax=Lujinxingia vulgaris TaxID=2600176 RepID=A0A5C6X8P0_9DELT|nr:transglycosylase SLT domain-containing protein [Lujinxingia vulgaris]TXD33502.1 tetratricopeptide repeat protein [Lujinxingia vulgaris]